MCGPKCNYDEKRLIDANAFLDELETIKSCLLGAPVSGKDRAKVIDMVIGTLSAAPTVQHECTCQKWHPASEIPLLHHEVDENECEGTLECDVSEQLLLYTEEEGYKVGVYIKDRYGFNGWLNPDYGGTIRHVVEWQYPQKPSKERSA